MKKQLLGTDELWPMCESEESVELDGGAVADAYVSTCVNEEAVAWY